MAKRDRICKCCGSAYLYCPSCSEDAGKPLWMFAYHTEACKELFETVSSYNSKSKTAEDVRSVIKKYNISVNENYLPNIQEVVSKVMRNKQSVRETIEISPIAEVVVLETPEQKPTDTNIEDVFNLEKEFEKLEKRNRTQNELNSDLL